MRANKILLILALLLTAVTGAWAQIPNPNVYDDVWDGVTKTKPWDVQDKWVTIHTAAELAYITEHWGEASSVVEGELCRDLNFSLVANLDMSAANWTPMGEKGDHRGKRNDYFAGKFYGNSHTICIKIDRPDSDDDELGLFKEINFGEVRDLHVTGKIEVGDAQEVGGICGTCEAGTIINCWVSADIKSSHYSSIEDAFLGGIAGKIRNGNYLDEKSTMQFCCMTGNVENPKNSGVGGLAGVAYGCNISHCALYGIVSVDHDQDNKWIGNMSESCTFENYYDSFNPDEYNAANGNDLYRYAIKYPYAINVTTVGQGSVTVSADGEDNIPGTRQHQEVTLTTTTGSTAEVTVTDADGNNLTLFGNSGASGYTFFMPQKNVNVHAIFTVPDWPRQGSGTTDSPYLITSADDWNEFALSVNAGINHSGKHVKLTNDISIWMMAGASKTNSFQGTFDGDGHTLTFNCNNTTSAVTAPFRYTKNAIIKNLRTAGSIATNAMNAAGIVGDVTGSLSLTNCCSAVTISSSRSDADFHGGLVASNNGSVTISGCVFDGSFVATVAHTNQYGTTYCGGFVGYGGSNSSTTITNSLVGTTSVSDGMVSNTFVGYSDGSSTLNITNSYFVSTTNLPTNQGTQARTITAGDYVTISDIGEATTTYGSDGITVYENGIKYRDTFFVVSGKTVSLTLSHGDKMGYHFSQYAASAGTISAQTETSATLTMPAANITISAEWTKFIDGTGTADDPYVIDNADKWNYFANSVTGGYTFSGEFVKLGANVSVSTMAGTSSNQFRGTFDGGGQTLTFTKGTSAEPFAEEYCAPFRHVKNAVIKNLHVAGTIYTSAKKAAGFVGESHGALTLTGCRSSISIHSSTVTGNDNHDGTHGGLVSTLSGENNTVTIDGCVFDGSFATTNGTINCGGFIGWVTYNKPTITNSLMKPSSVGAGMLANTFSRWHTGYEPTITNCYYVATDNLPTNQGLGYSFDTALANIGTAGEAYTTSGITPYTNGLLYDGRYYMTPEAISLADTEANDVVSINGFFADVTLSGRTLYKDGAWNTICLPFNVTIASSPLAGATARPLTSASISGSTLTLTFGDAVTTLKAGTPYIIKWASGDNIVSPVFSGVTIDKTDRSYDNEASGDQRVRFIGTYKSTAFDAEDQSILLMGGENMLYYPTTGAGIGAQHAYLKIGDGAQLARLKAFRINFGDDETSGILSLSKDSRSAGESWFTLDGRKLDGKPTRKGLYINNGVKVVIK